MGFLLPWKRADVAIDFGTANLRVIRLHDGVVFDEPSVCCFTHGGPTATLVAAGSEAQPMLDRTPAHLRIRQPLRRGVLQDLDTAREMLRYALARLPDGRRARATRGLFGVPADATAAERSALLTAAHDAGFRSAQLVAEPFAAAIGADLPVHEPVGTMIVECGAGTTEVAVLSLGGIVLTRSVRRGGAALDRAIADHLHFRHKFLVGDATAETLKRAYVEARLDPDTPRDATLQIKGRSLGSGMPTAIAIALAELDQVVERHVAQIIDVVRNVLLATPPELSYDIHDRGIVLTGGSALTPLLQSMIAGATGLSVILAPNPAHCVANGLHRMLERRAGEGLAD
ncbi:MAG TPA: rod shape-determining protein [Sphingobium sp.]|nr:rod shape-determining protein [Sphingobium sp.]